MTTEFKVGTKVARKSDGETLGVITRFLKNGVALVKKDIDTDSLEIKTTRLVVVTVGRPSKGDGAPANEPRDKSAVDATMEIQVKITGTIRVPNWELIQRRFKTVDGAAEYLSSFGELVNVEGRVGRLKAPAEAEVYTNYDIADILAKTPPKKSLPVILLEANKRALVMPATMPESVTPPQGDKEAVSRGVAMKAPDAAKAAAKAVPASASQGAKLNGELVVLKTICQDAQVEPREARIRLRAALKKGTVPEGDAGRWAWKPEDVPAVMAILKGSAPLPAAPAPTKPKPPEAKEAPAVKAAVKASKSVAAKAKPKKPSLKERMQERKAAKVK